MQRRDLYDGLIHYALVLFPFEPEEGERLDLDEFAAIGFLSRFLGDEWAMQILRDALAAEPDAENGPELSDDEVLAQLARRVALGALAVYRLAPPAVVAAAAAVPPEPQAAAPIEQPVPPVPPVVPAVPPPKVLRMYMDADRDGVVDQAPATYGNWQWGPPAGQVDQVQRGAIVMMRADPPGLFGQAPPANLAERAELEFRWDNNEVERQRDWTARLTVNPANRLRFYASRARNAPALALQNDAIDIKAQPAAAEGRVQLYMEATDFGADADENSWRVSLTFAFTPESGAAARQTAELRIAPWIMASDLDETATVLAVSEDVPANVASSIKAISETANAAFARRPIQRGMAQDMLKPFLRDPMKAGYLHAPHQQSVTILRELDDPDRCYYLTIYKIANTTNVKRPADLAPASQDNGGNLLVTPPLPNYPLGRMLYGEGANAPCQLAPFFRNQRVQKPFSIDPTSLGVGHVDEMVSFVPNVRQPDEAWPWRILLISPRLGYILACAASAQPTPANVDTLIDQAEQINAQAGGDDWNALRQRCIQQWGNPVAAADPGAAAEADLPGPGAYSADSAPPAGQNGKVVFWTSDNNYRVQSIHSYLTQANPHAAQGNAPPLHPGAYDETRQVISAARQTLRRELGDVDDNHVIDIPVLLSRPEANKFGTHSADSVNMLVLRTANATHCLVPKPFGPVSGNTYIFERYIRRKLEALGLNVTFANDWEWFHSHHGEIHCGTNQIPRPLSADRAWWRQAPV